MGYYKRDCIVTIFEEILPLQQKDKVSSELVTAVWVPTHPPGAGWSPMYDHLHTTQHRDLQRGHIVGPQSHSIRPHSWSTVMSNSHATKGTRSWSYSMLQALPVLQRHSGFRDVDNPALYGLIRTEFPFKFRTLSLLWLSISSSTIYSIILRNTGTVSPAILHQRVRLSSYQ